VCKYIIGLEALMRGARPPLAMSLGTGMVQMHARTKATVMVKVIFSIKMSIKLLISYEIPITTKNQG